ncbi:hypothetical protein BHE74_00043640 [Ensete ventricosum]|nr:hypothetical protein BHE74_00043640 [Ensete ventricosum]
MVSLHVTFGEEPLSKTPVARFMVVDVPSTYNAIIDQLTLNHLRVMVATYHMVMKFSTKDGFGEVRGDPQIQEVLFESNLTPKKDEAGGATHRPSRPCKGPPHPEPMEQLVEVPLNKA